MAGYNPSNNMANVDITHLPVTDALFVGRQRELAQLDAAWSDDTTNVFCVTAVGGAGKTALVNHWLTTLADRHYDGVRVFGWSFYSQGTDERRVASSDEFLARAWHFFTGERPPVGVDQRALGRALAERVRAEKALLVLDGTEPLQHPVGHPNAGRLKDGGLAVLLRTLAAENTGLCVVTTRQQVVDVQPLRTTFLDLERMSEDDGAEFLAKLGVQGTKKELVETTREYGGHGLALRLLGNYLVNVYDGEVRCKDKVPLLDTPEEDATGRHAFRVMHAYEKQLGERALNVLRLLGLFVRPATKDALDALRAEPAIPSLTDDLVGLRERDWKWTLASLRSHGLVLQDDANARGSVDAHPLVREYFADVLRELFPDAWRDGHLRLYAHLCRSAPDLPDTVEEMRPLFAAVVHGCRAGRQQEVLDEVYVRRIQRGDEFYSAKKLGALGLELTALAGFFDRPWDQPSGELNEGERAFVLNAAGFRLRALGRLGEAVQPMRVGVELAKKLEDWENGAIGAGNVSELSLTLGNVEEAVTFGEEGVRLADRNRDAIQRMVDRVHVGNALHQAGRFDESADVFAKAEALQKERQSQYPLLYSIAGYHYCNLLLGRLPWGMSPWEGGRPARPRGRSPRTADSSSNGTDFVREGGRDARPPSNECVRKACEDVLERATQTLGWATKHLGLLDIALDNVTLGRAHFGLALCANPSPQPPPPPNVEPKDQERAGGGGAGRDFVPGAEHLRLARTHLDEAVQGFLRGGREDHLPRGLLARAALHRVNDDIDAARVDLDETFEIAERGGMRLHLCDAHLENVCLAVAGDDIEAARRSLAEARRLVDETGYHRRDEDLAELEALLNGIRQSEPSASATEPGTVSAPSSEDEDVAPPSSKDAVVLCGSPNDKSVVDALRTDIAGMGFKTWTTADVLPGENVPRTLRQAVQDAAAVVVCWSRALAGERSSDLNDVLRDAIDAYRKRRPGAVYIILARLDDCVVPDLEIDASTQLPDLRTLDLFPDSERLAALQRLRQALAAASQI